MATRRWAERLRFPFQIAPDTGGEGTAPERREALTVEASVGRLAPFIRTPPASTIQALRGVQSGRARGRRRGRSSRPGARSRSQVIKKWSSIAQHPRWILAGTSPTPRWKRASSSGPNQEQFAGRNGP